ncbi:MAG: hypothetical protein ACLFPL_00770 [Candidatus Nanoarchaeia archaeon]
MDSKKSVSMLEFENNSQIGMYFLATDKFVLCGKKELTPEQIKQIENVLHVPLISISCYNSDLIGVFLQVDKGSNIIYVPHDLYEEELEELNTIADKYEFSIVRVVSTNNALGNLIAPTPTSNIISYELKSQKSFIEKQSKKETLILTNEDYHQAGALVYSSNSKTLASSLLDDESLEKIESSVDNITTANSGSAYVSSAIVGNSYGVLVGSATTSVEVQIILETLEYL